MAQLENFWTVTENYHKDDNKGITTTTKYFKSLDKAKEYVQRYYGYDIHFDRLCETLVEVNGAQRSVSPPIKYDDGTRAVRKSVYFLQQRFFWDYI